MTLPEPPDRIEPEALEPEALEPEAIEPELFEPAALEVDPSADDTVTLPVSRRQALWVGIVAGTLAVLLVLFSLWHTQNGLSRDVRALRRSLGSLEQRLADHQRTNEEARARLSAVEQKVGRQLDPAAIAKKALPSVFTIEVGSFLGSGFAIDRRSSSSFIVTNHHVVASVGRGGSVRVRQKGRRTLNGVVTVIDPDNDLALVRVRAELETLELAEREPRAGDPVVVVGSPLGLEGSVTSGIISGRQQDLLQFSATIAPGSSGGPVLDREAHVVGVATLKIVGIGVEGLGFAVPAGVVCDRLLDC